VPAEGDGQVTIADVIGVLTNFGSNTPQFDVAPSHGDGTYGDGAITISDITLVMTAFGPCVLP
jgi:hypothetical protein